MIIKDKHLTYLYSLTIPKFLTSVILSQSRRAKYYSTTSGPGRTKKLPKTLERKGYTVDIFGYYLDNSGNRVISNTRSVGKPRLLPINNQYIYSGKGSHHSRTAIVDGLKGFLTPYVQTMPVFKETELPLFIDCELHTSLSGQLPDGDNFGNIYGKVFSDCMVREGKIPDDSYLYITKPCNSPMLYPVKDMEDRKLVYHFYHDNRKEVQQLTFFKKD